MNKRHSLYEEEVGTKDSELKKNSGIAAFLLKEGLKIPHPKTWGNVKSILDPNLCHPWIQRKNLHAAH